MADALLLKVAARAREGAEKREQERRRSALVLILRHLCDFGYVETYERLCTESNLSLSKVIKVTVTCRYTLIGAQL